MLKNDDNPQDPGTKIRSLPTDRTKRTKRAPLRDVSNNGRTTRTSNNSLKTRGATQTTHDQGHQTAKSIMHGAKPPRQHKAESKSDGKPYKSTENVRITRAAAKRAEPKAQKRSGVGGSHPLAEKGPQPIKRDRELHNKAEPSTKRPRRASLRKLEKPVGAEVQQLKRSKTRRNSGTRDFEQPNEGNRLCSDFVETTDYNLLREPFDAAKFTAGVSTHDATKAHDILEVSGYVTDIFQRLFHAEKFHQPGDYIGDQPQINAMMRAILVDWLVEVHMKFHLVPETLYLAVNILDRYCSIVHVERRRLQLVGVTALLLACKYEEIYPPEVRDCVYITDRAYSRQEVLDMEQDIVKQLKFKMTVPTAYPFMLRFLLVTKASKLTTAAANYYLERTLQEYVFVNHRSSLVAAAAVCLALNNPGIRASDKVSGPKPGVPRVLLEYTGFEKVEILKVACKIAEKIKEEIVTASQRELVAVKRKYDSRKFHHISTSVTDPETNDLLD